MKLFISIALVLCLTDTTLGFFGYTRKFNTHDEPFIPHLRRVLNPKPKVIQEKYIEQRVDNFDPQENRLWKMRYFENDEFRQPNGSIFIYVGGEWSISAGSISKGTHIYELAKEHNGTLFYTEHRYYGKSHPTANTSTENLRFLTVDQALADLAFFITHIKSSSPDFTNSGVVMVGGSYSATMVAWMRLKYPHLVSGAWASSAPISAELDFTEYKDVMTDAIKRVGGDDCYATFKNAFQQMEEVVEMGNASRINQAFNLCGPLDLSQDIAHFFYETSDIIAGLVQSHRAGNIESACDFVEREKEQNKKEDLEAFASWVNHDSFLCMDMSYKNNVKKFRNIDWGSEANRQMRQWTYQTCNEFAWFQTSSSTSQIFGTLYPLDYFVKICQDLYDFPFDLKTIEQNVKRTNLRYGGFTPKLSNVYFTNGDIDPWHPKSLLKDLNESVLSTIIPYSAHVSDLGQIADYDSKEKRDSKEKVQVLVRQWLSV